MHSIIVFDIRNFSTHRQFLGKNKKARLIADLIKSILNNTTRILIDITKLVNDKTRPILNHTGDGFVLVLREKFNPLKTCLFVSILRPWLENELKNYQTRFLELFPNEKLRKLDYGIGIHYGQVSIFNYDFIDPNGKNKKYEGFIGTAINIASMIEQCTKDHPYKVLCTEKFYQAGNRILPIKHQKEFTSHFVSIGKHILRGLSGSVNLYVFKQDFHNNFSINLLSSFLTKRKI